MQKKQIYYNGEPTTYYITEDGKLYNEKTGRWYKGRVSPSGYLDYILRINGVQVAKRAHRLVAEYFLDEHSEEKNIVNHKDGNKLNNHYSNLEWTTASENTQHAVLMGLISSCTKFEQEIEDYENEEWKPLSFLCNNDLYQVSNYGRIMNRVTKKILKTYTGTGYARISLYNNEKEKTWLLHRLIYKAFHDDFDIYDTKRIINHKNGDKLDNRIENLEEVTREENVQHAYATGLNSKARPIIQYDLKMNFIKEYPSANEAARQLNICQGLISSACKRAGTSHGFNWRYKDNTQKDVQRP